MLSIKLNADRVLSGLTDLQLRQVPFAMANAINRTAEEVQTAEQDHISSVFKIRSPWVLTNVKINRSDFATKTKMQAIVQIIPDSVLDKFEGGGIKTSRTGGGHVAIPVNVTHSKSDIIPSYARPRAYKLVANTANDGLIAKGAQNTFLITIGNGRELLLQRVGKRSKAFGKGKGKDPNLQVLWMMVPSARIPNLLDFYTIGQRVAVERFGINMQGMMDYALKTAK